MKKRILQKMANFIVDRIKSARTLKAVEVWLNIGLNINARLIEKDIWLV